MVAFASLDLMLAFWSATLLRRFQPNPRKSKAT
jgi:hypothetical protein